MVLPLPLLAVLCVCVATSFAQQQAEILYEWTALDFAWETPQQRQAYIDQDLFVPENCAIAGIKAFGGVLYVTVPRWRHGVPSTLNTVVMEGGVPVLQPYPSWAWQNITDPSEQWQSLWYVQSMEIDPRGVMWIIDVGRLNIFDDASLIVNGPPRLLLYDTVHGQLLRTFVFPNSVASYTASFLNDIVLDVPRGMAYISDAGVGSLIVYSYTQNAAWMYQGISTQRNPAVMITINNISYPNIQTPEDGIALSPDTNTLYYCALQGNTLYSLPTSVLQQPAANNSVIDQAVVAVGPKPPSDGLAMTAAGVLYYGALTENSLFSWDSSLPYPSANLVVHNDTTFQWQDTFAFDGLGALFVTSNRLQLYFAKTMNISAGADANFRIFKIPGAGMSYLAAQVTPSPTSPPSSGTTYSNQQMVGAVLGTFFGALLLFLVALWLSRRGGARSRGGAKSYALFTDSS